MHIDRVPSPSFPRVLLCAALSGLVFFGVACDQFKSDTQRADERVKKSAQEAARKKGPTTQAMDAAISELQKAVNESAASESGKVGARAVLAQTQFEDGQRVIRELHLIEPEVQRAMWDVGQLAGQVGALNVIEQATQGTNPKAALETVSARQEEMQQMAAAAGEKAKALQGQIAQIETQIKTLTDQKNQVQGTADADAAKARDLKEKEAHPVLLTVIENRRKAGNIGHDIDKLSASLLPLQADLAVQQTTQKNLQEGVAALDQRKQTFEGNWNVSQEQLVKQKQLIGDLARQLATRSAELDAKATEAAKTRGRVIDQLTKAADNYANAARNATQLSQALKASEQKYPEAPERKAWKELLALYDLNNFKLLEGQVRNTLGNVHARHAKLAAARKQLAADVSKILQVAGQSVPPALAGSADADLAAATKSADDAYKAAATLMDNVANVGQPAARPAGQVGQLFAAYGQYLTSGKPEDLNLAKDHYVKLKEDPTIQTLPDGMRQVLSR
jgi:uncharacterized protein YfcZ (UPF0381/DUF406 family)